MKEKSTAILICIMATLTMLGIGYAQWNDAITIAGTLQFGYWNNSLNIGFIEPLKCFDNELIDDVGRYNCYYTNEKTDPETGMTAYNTTIIEISNAYPGYIVYCNFTLKNIGILTAHINETRILDPSGKLAWNSTLNALTNENNEPIIKIYIKPDLTCNSLNAGETLEAEVDIKITQNAEPCQIYRLQIEIFYEEEKI